MLWKSKLTFVRLDQLKNFLPCNSQHMSTCKKFFSSSHPLLQKEKERLPFCEWPCIQFPFGNDLHAGTSASAQHFSSLSFPPEILSVSLPFLILILSYPYPFFSFIVPLNALPFNAALFPRRPFPLCSEVKGRPCAV